MGSCIGAMLDMMLPGPDGVGRAWVCWWEACPLLHTPARPPSWQAPAMQAPFLGARKESGAG